MKKADLGQLAFGKASQAGSTFLICTITPTRDNQPQNSRCFIVHSFRIEKRAGSGYSDSWNRN